MDDTNTPLYIDNTDDSVRDVFRNHLNTATAVRVAAGYFRLSGFVPLAENIAAMPTVDADENDGDGTAPFRVLMGDQTDRPTAEELDTGHDLRERLNAEMDEFNDRQLRDLHQLREFIAEGIVAVRVRTPDGGYFHAKGATFHHDTTDHNDADGTNGGGDSPPVTAVVGTSNFTQAGHSDNIELNLVTDDAGIAEGFDSWFDSQWTLGEDATEDVLEVIDENDTYREWREREIEKDDPDPEDDPEDVPDIDFGTRIEPLEMYKVLAYDALNGRVETRESPLFEFQRIGYESAREKTDRYGGCIISDSVGLGKSFIGAELLRDHRQQNENCLLIVPANVEDQWRTLLEEETDDEGRLLFDIPVDGDHIRILSITKFQNLPYEEARALRDEFDVALVDEAHRFRNHGEWRHHPAHHEDDYRGTRRHANLRLLRGMTMIHLTATPVNNTAADLKNILSLFTDANELRNRAGLDFGAFDDYIDIAQRRKDIVTGKESLDPGESLKDLTERLSDFSEQISVILNEVMVLRTRNHIDSQITDAERDRYDFDFEDPTVTPENYDLPPVYRPVYGDLPVVMDALHLPHITARNPESGATLKALYKLNLLKRLESSTYAFLNSVETIYESEQRLLQLVEEIADPETTSAGVLADPEALADAGIETDDIGDDVADLLEDFGVDAEEVTADTTARADGGAIAHAPSEAGEDAPPEIADTTVSDIRTYIREDLALLANFIQSFVPDIAADGDAGATVADEWAELRPWLRERRADTLPVAELDDAATDVGGMRGRVYPGADLTDVETRATPFYEAAFRVEAFRDPKVDRLVDLLERREGEKVLVFTQYRGTARYLHRTLVEERPDGPVTEANSTVVTGNTDDKRTAVKRLSPDANNYRDAINNGEDTELTYVVATNTLSEGVNAQDVNVVVNYDLPWNPMRIVQRVGRIDRIGSSTQKHVHNFFPDEDIDAAITLLERLQAKISDIALVVGKERNILDPNEDEVLDRAGVETEKTIGEIEIEEIEGTIRGTRTTDSVADYDDTARNPLLRDAGSDEQAALERVLLRRELTDPEGDYALTEADFEFAADYHARPLSERDPLYTRVAAEDCGVASGAAGLGYAWASDGDGGNADDEYRRDSRLYHAPRRGGEVEVIRHIRRLGIDADADPDLGTGSDPIPAEHRLCGAVNDALAEDVREIQRDIGGGELSLDFSKTQRMVLSALEALSTPGDAPINIGDADPDTVGERASQLYDRLSSIGLANTDADRALRDEFREEDRAIGDRTAGDLLDAVDAFVEEHIDESPEFQTELMSTSEVDKRVFCWTLIDAA